MTTTVRRTRPAAKTGNPKTDTQKLHEALDAAGAPKSLTVKTDAKPGTMSYQAQVAEELSKMQPGDRKTINGVPVRRNKDGFSVRARSETKNYPTSPSAAATVAAKRHIEPQLNTHVFLLMRNADFRVHAAGCRDIAKEMKECEYDKPAPFSPADEEAAVRELWADQIRESWDGDPSETPTTDFLHDHSYVVTVDFAPCCELDAFPAHSSDGSDGKDEPKTEAPAKTDKPTKTGSGERRAAKREIARAVVTAISGMLADANGNLPGKAVYSEDEVKRIVSQWIHHLPVHDDSEHDIWWPENMPRPERSDWAARTAR